MKAHDLRKLRWSLSNLSIDCSGYLLQLCVFDGLSKRNIKLNASPDTSIAFEDRIQCSCEYTHMNGYPCYHAAFALVFLPVAVYPPSIWSYASNKWYSSIYHVESDVGQYSGDVNIPCQAAGFILFVCASRV